MLSRIRKKVIPFESLAPGELPGENKAFMKKTNPNNGLRPEYDFASINGGVRAKYAKRYQESTNIVLLEPDIAEAFPNDAAVNQALRGVQHGSRCSRHRRPCGKEPANSRPTSDSPIKTGVESGCSTRRLLSNHSMKLADTYLHRVSCVTYLLTAICCWAA